MKTIVLWLLLMAGATYGWGWVQMVHSGRLSQERYNTYCLQRVRTVYDSAASRVSFWIDQASKPLYRHEAALE